MKKGPPLRRAFSINFLDIEIELELGWMWT